MLYGFTARDCDRLHALLAAYEQGRIRVDVPAISRSNSHQQDVFLAQPAASIAAGEIGTAYLVNLNTSTPTPGQTVETSLPTISIYNTTSNALAVATVPVVRENSQGYYLPAAAGLPQYNQTTTTGATQALTGAWATLSSFSLALPSAGTYLISGSCPTFVGSTAGNSTNALLRLFDITNAVQIGILVNAMSCGSATATSPLSVGGMVPLFAIYTVTGAANVGIQGEFTTTGGGAASFGGGAWLSCLQVG